MAMMKQNAMLKFRSVYREGISTYYNGWLHMASVLVVGLSVIIFSCSQLNEVILWEWLIFPCTMIVVNFAEYYAHRWLGHRKTKYGQLFYQRHTGDHHSFFLEHAMAFSSPRDWRVVLFPLYLIFAFTIGLIVPVGYLLAQGFSWNVAYLYAAAGISGYLFYEIMHFSYHIPRGHWSEKFFLAIPGWGMLRQLHVLHHKRDKMTEANFNITLPIFDLLLGSLFWLPIKKDMCENKDY
ncbi:MAG: hypothetical protein ACI935_003345 [Moritella dasanensis]|jgi:hypothetical protein